MHVMRDVAKSMSQILDEAESRDSQLNLRAFYTVYTTQPQPLLHSLRVALLQT